MNLAPSMPGDAHPVPWQSSLDAILLGLYHHESHLTLSHVQGPHQQPCLGQHRLPRPQLVTDRSLGTSSRLHPMGPPLDPPVTGTQTVSYLQHQTIRQQMCRGNIIPEVRAVILRWRRGVVKQGAMVVWKGSSRRCALEACATQLCYDRTCNNPPCRWQQIEIKNSGWM